MSPQQPPHIRPAEGLVGVPSRIKAAERDQAYKVQAVAPRLLGILQFRGRAGADLEDLCAEVRMPGGKVRAVLSDLPGVVQHGGRWYVGSNDPALHKRGRR